MPERPGVVIFTDDFLHLKCRFAAFDRRRLSRGDRERQATTDEWGYNSLSTIGMAMKG
jgi:hypothetical protein